MKRKGPMVQSKKMAELSATLYEQFACLCVACLRAARRQARRQADADRLDLPAEAPAVPTAQAGATIKRNLPACRSLFGAGREVLGYGE